MGWSNVLNTIARGTYLSHLVIELCKLTISNLAMKYTIDVNMEHLEKIVAP